MFVGVGGPVATGRLLERTPPHRVFPARATDPMALRRGTHQQGTRPADSQQAVSHILSAASAGLTPATHGGDLYPLGCVSRTSPSIQVEPDGKSQPAETAVQLELPPNQVFQAHPHWNRLIVRRQGLRTTKSSLCSHHSSVTFGPTRRPEGPTPAPHRDAFDRPARGGRGGGRPGVRQFRQRFAVACIGRPQVTSPQNSSGPISQGDHPRAEFTATH